jgi:predicted amidohydrolase YtcJ
MSSLLLHGGEIFPGSGAAPVRSGVVVEDGRVVEIALRGH